MTVSFADEPILRQRCAWCSRDPLYIDYHDREWGVPLHDDQRLFELLVLEGFQAGLNWVTILRKRENFRKAFHNFNAKRIAQFSQEDLARLAQDPGIVRNKLKIAASVANANAYLVAREEFGSFDQFIWSFAPHPETPATTKPTTPESDLMSKDLFRRGFKFVGSTICYAFMQSSGMVNDHTENCWKYRAR
jgi:DNA-3-methyladenine glycosylase I